jgi:signal transduction histidine kinase
MSVVKPVDTRETPLFRKVLIGTTVLFAAAAIALSIASAVQVSRSLTDEFRSKGTAIASSVAASAVELLLNRDASTLQDNIDQFLQIRGVAYVFVSDEHRDIVTHTFVPSIPEGVRQVSLNERNDVREAITIADLEVPGVGSYIDVAAPILSGVAGTVHVGMDKAVIAADVRRAILQQTAILLGIFGIGLVLAYGFVNRTSQPLRALTAYVNRLAHSDFQHLETDAAVDRIADGARDEVGSLARAFRRMAATLTEYIDQLRSAKDELADYSRSLEQRVQERTEELVEKNRTLEDTLGQLKQAQEQVITQEKLASLGALTAGIAHEIKNPLNFVNNFAQLSTELTTELRETLEKTLPEEQRADALEIVEMLQMNVQKINEHGKRADSIVKNMLLHSRKSKGERTEVDVNALLNEYLGLAYHGVRGQDKSFNAKLETHYDPAVGSISAIPQDLSRAFLNILTNACHALAEKQKKLGDGFAPVLAVSTAARAHEVEIRIRDNGPGIPPDVRKKIFEPFFTTKPAGSGTGLGLSMTFDIIVQAHKGRIDVNTEPGEYAEFVITLPRNEAA